jgi:predicted permease
MATKVYNRIKSLFNRRKLERDLQDELRSHVEMDKLERIQQGESPEEANHNASRDFGNFLLPAEAVRETWGTAGIERLVQDARYSFRQMKRNPGFVAVAIITLGLGIGANTSIFSIVNAILLKPLPYKNSERLVRIIENIPAEESYTGAPLRTTSMSPEAFQEWRSKAKTLSGMALERPVSMTLTGREAVRLAGLQVSPDLFPLLGTQPGLGRVFEPNEERPGYDKVIILSYRAWLKYFGADPQILRTVLTLDDATYTVVGVMPRDFTYPDAQTEFWIPFVLPPRDHILGLQVIARLKDGIPLAAAAEEASRIGRELRGESQGEPQPDPPRIQLMTMKEELVAPIRLPLLVFVISVAFVLLVACINVANLFLARASTRNREIAIRLALGAGRRRVLRQLFTENFLVAGFGGAIGIVLAFAATRVFPALGQSLARMDLMRFESAGNAVPRLNEVSMDTSLLLFTLAVTVITGILFGLIPALQTVGTHPIRTADLHVAGSSKLTLKSVRAVMIIGQVALTMTLMLGAGLLIKSFVKLANTKLGYDPGNVLTFQIPRPELSFPEDVPKQRQRTAFEEEVVRRLESLPDIQSTAYTNRLPMIQMTISLGVNREGSASIPEVDCNTVSTDYFRVMGIRVIEGRSLSAADRVSSRPAYLINRTLAKQLFPNGDSVGKAISIGPHMAPGDIIGVVDDVRQLGFDAEPKPALFVDPEHTIGIIGTSQGGVYFTVRTEKPAAAVMPQIRGILRNMDPDLVLDNVATMDLIVSNSITTPKSYAVLMGTFSAAAFALATIGLYGVLTYFVTQRRQEIGIRLALGAKRRDVVLLILRRGLAFGLTGIVLGLAGGVALTQYLRKMLFGVGASDPITFIVVCVVFMTVILIASYIPARQATRIDPLLALRYE